MRRGLNDAPWERRNLRGVRDTKSKAVLPIGRTAQIAFQMEALRADCCAAARILADEKTLNEAELEECAQLDDALAAAQRLLKSTVADVMIARLKRRSSRVE
jgi:class 3 adenylate cyclase